MRSNAWMSALAGLWMVVILAGAGCGSEDPAPAEADDSGAEADAGGLAGDADDSGDVGDGGSTLLGDGETPGPGADIGPKQDVMGDVGGEDVIRPDCVADQPCDDGDPCTALDVCSAQGQCLGQAYGCDDGRACTTDTCLGDGDCRFEVTAGTCLIANVCYDPGESHPQNPCVACDPDQSPSEWSRVADDTACAGDGNCVLDGVCAEGKCTWSLLDCDDQDPCTDDVCDAAEGCQHPQNFEACEDGDPCTIGDFCQAGVCVPSLIPLVCDDGEPCTNDVCGPQGCLFVPRSGLCDDGTACTGGDFCEKGACISGAPLACNDGNVCTLDTCDPFLGCVHGLVDSQCCVAGKSLCDDQNPCTDDVCDEEQATCNYTANDATCDDGKPCTGPDSCLAGECSGGPLSCDDQNPCTDDSCVDSEGGCVNAPVTATCDDNNACTVADACVGGTCVGKPLSCSDGDACTQDTCAPASGCANLLLVGPCNDGDVCTGNDTCGPAGCTGIAKSCNDQNACTNDSCNPLVGCQHQPIGGACDDGLACSVGDSCVAGQCVADTSACGCLPDFGDVVTKVTLLGFGADGSPGQGLDVDKNPSTCAPAGKCSGGIDNTLATFAFLANDPLQKAIQEGQIMLLLDHQGFDGSAQSYTLNFYPGDLPSGAACDFMAAVCDYEVKQEGLDQETCLPLITFPNAKITGDTLTAGGQGFAFPLAFPIGDAVIGLSISNAEIQATVTIQNGQITAFTGVLGGAIPKQSFLDGIDAVPAKDLPDKDAVKQLISVLVQNDIDTDGDGSPDAASVGLVLDGIQGHILGLEK